MALTDMLDIERFRNAIPNFSDNFMPDSYRSSYERLHGQGSFDADKASRRIVAPNAADATKLATEQIVPLFQKQFKNVIGRAATDPEIASMFNEMNFAETFGRARQMLDAKELSLPSEDILDPATLTKIVGDISALNPYLTARKPLYTEITKANNQLKQIGQSLTSEQVQDILSSPDKATASEVASSYANTMFDDAVKKETASLQPKQEAAIGDLANAFTQQNQTALSRDFAPMIAQELNKRGMLSGGDLASSLASTAGTLQQKSNDILNPLMANVKLGGANATYDSVLRGQLAGNKSLDDAINFSRNFYNQGIQNQFAAGQNAMSQASQNELYRQQMAMQMAMQPKQQQPSGLDYFLQYGLPTLTKVGTTAMMM